MAKHFVLILILTSFFVHPAPVVLAQTNNTLKADNHQVLIEDYDYFISQLEAIHPDSYSAYGGEADFRKRTDSLRFVLKEDQSLNAKSLQRQISRFLIPLHDGHTYCGYMDFGQERENRFLPINFHATSEGFYVSGGAKTYEDLIGAQLKEVGGLSIDELLERIALLTAAENKFGLFDKLLDSRLCSAMLKQILDNFDGQQVEMQFSTRDGADTCMMIPLLVPEEIKKLKGSFPNTDSRFPTQNLEYKWADKQRGVMTFRCTHVISRDCLAFMRDNGMEYQSTLEWAWGDTPLDSVPSIASQFGAMLEEMKTNEAQHLIIDLRGNGGGWTPIVYATLYQLFGDEYLSKDLSVRFDTKLSEQYLKKNVTTLEELNSVRGSNYQLGEMISGFDGQGITLITDSIRQQVIENYICLGKELLHRQNGAPLYRPQNIYVVTDQETFSAAFHYAFMLWKMGATIVGIPSSQAPNTFMEITDFSLPNTGIICSVSNSIQTLLPDDDPRAKIFWPDWMMMYDDYKRYEFDANSELLYILDHLRE